MSFTLNPASPIPGDLKHLVRHQLRRAEARLRTRGGDGVHEARKSVKKVRAIITLLRQANTGALGKDERRLRSAGRALSVLRDADAALATVDRLRERFPSALTSRAAGAVRHRLVQIKTRVEKDAQKKRHVARARHVLRAVRRSVKGWELPEIGSADLAHLVRASYRASRRAMRRALETGRAPDLHRWRKRVKTLWYQLRLIESRAPGLRTEIQHLEQLETWLGEHQNLAVLHALIANDKAMIRQPLDAVRGFKVVSRREQQALRHKALAGGRRVLNDRPKVFARRLQRALSARRQRARSTPRTAGA